MTTKMRKYVLACGLALLCSGCSNFNRQDVYDRYFPPVFEMQEKQRRRPERNRIKEFKKRMDPILYEDEPTYT